MAYNTPGDPDYIGYTGDIVTPTTTPQRRFNTTPAWGDPLHAPNPSDPYYAEWRAANPGIPESEAEPVGNQVDVYGNPYGKKPDVNPDPGTTPPPPGPGPGLGPLLEPWGGKYTPPPPIDNGGGKGTEYLPPVPTFTPPTFKMPTADDLYADPSYQLRRQEGEDGVVNSAAAKGLVRSGGDLSDILKYNQGFASNEYGNVADRKFRQFATDYQGASDAFAPLLDQWRTVGQAAQRQNELNNDQAWAQYLERYREWDDQRKFTYGSLSDQQRIGIDAATR